MKKYRISAIVPAFNEEKKIRHVLKVLLSSKQLDEVICIDDGSVDKTASCMRDLIASVKKQQNQRSQEKHKILSYKKNHGKAYAIARGIEKSKGDIVLFFDADIKGLNEKSIRQLASPLTSGKYDVAIGYRRGAMEATVGVPFSGERAYFRKDLIPHIKHFENKGYGLELYLNYIFRAKRKKVFQLHNVSSSPKGEKYPRIIATKLYANETYQVFYEFASQKNLLSYFRDSYLQYVYFRNQALHEYLSKPISFNKEVISPKLLQNHILEKYSLSFFKRRDAMRS